MTDKVQKIREEVEIVVNRRLNLLNGDYFDLNEETDGLTNEIMDIINSLQEEPAGLDKGKLMGMLEDSLSKETKDSWNERLDKKEPVSEDCPIWLDELDTKLKSMSKEEFQKVMRKYEEECKLQEEPVSDDLEAEIEQYCIKHGYLDSAKDCGFTFNEQVGDIARHFANWQKQQCDLHVQKSKKDIGKPVSEDFEKIVEEIAEPTILNAYGTKELARRLRNTIYGTSVSEGLKEASKEWLSPQLDKSYAAYGETKQMELTHFDGYAMLDAIEFGAKWQKANLWKPADGDDLPEYERDVIALEGIVDSKVTDCLCGYKVIFAHRPNPDGWEGKSITTGNVEHYVPKTYGKGGWSVSDVKYWLNIKFPNE